MVVKDTRNVRTGTKPPPDRLPLRRLPSLDKTKVGRKTPREKMAAKIFEELEEINSGVDKQTSMQTQAHNRTPPHYQLPTENSKQARVLSKTLTPSPDFVRVRRFSLGLDKSPSVCKYDSRDIRRSSLGSKSGGGLRSPNTGLKPYDKTPAKTSRLKMKSLGGGEKTQALKSPSDKTPIPRRPLQSVALKAARDTCSSSCKHVVKGGDLTVSPEPRCPYVYCSLNHLHRESPPPLKQFLASRRRLLKTQKSFKWVGLTPVPKGSVDRADGVVYTGQDLYVVGGGKDDAGEDDVLVLRGKMDGGISPSLEDSQIVDCDDYDDGHSSGDLLVSEFGEANGCNQIEIDGDLLDELNAKAVDEEDLEPLGAEDDDIKYGGHELGVEASHGDVDESVEEFAEDEDLKKDNHELGVEAPPDVDESTEEFVKDEDVKHDNYEIDLEPTNENGWNKISGILADESAVEARSDESVELVADNEDGRDGKLKFDVDYDYDYGQIDDTQVPCFIQEYALGAQCSPIAEHDGLPHESFSADNDDISESQDGEALSVVDGGNCKDQFEGCMEDYDKIEETGQQCFIQLHVLGVENSGQTEPDSPQVESYSEVNSGMKDGVPLPEGCDSVSVSSEGGSVSEASVTDHAEQPAGYANVQIEDTEHRCFIEVNSFRNECNGDTGSDGLPIVVEEEHHTTSSSSESGSISHLVASDHIEHASGSVSDHDQIEDSEQQCFIWLNAQVTECSSHAEPNGLPYAPLPDSNSCIKDEIKGDNGFASESPDDGSAYEIGINNVMELDNDKSNELDSSSTVSGETKSYILVDTDAIQCNSQIEFDSPTNKSVVDTNANSSSKQESKEECIPITKNLFDGFDDDYNLANLFAECSDEINLEIESHWPVQFDSSGKQFSIPSNFDDELDEALCEFYVSTKFEGEDSHTSGDDECVSEVYDNDVEKHYVECELLENECLRASDDYADAHAKNTNLSQPVQEEACGAHYTIRLDPGNCDDRFLFGIDVASNSDAREECHDIYEISLNESSTECKQIKKELKKLRSISEKNEKKPYRLKFRRGRVHPFLDQLSEAEKIDLRHQMIEERRASREWMVDYALTKIVKKLSPFRKRKVELLVEAFETVIPLSKCETDLPHATTDSTCRRPIQACN